MPIGPGTRLGPYAITALLGEGGMGTVWRAHHLELKRDDALKVLPDAFASDADGLARFQREAQVLASLNHPNIAHVYGLERADGVQALVMELVEGPTLADRIAQGSIPLDEALPIARQIAEALEAAHEQGIIHRDLKPANVKVRPDGTVKVLDFGLAKALEPAGPRPDASQSPTITSPAMMTGVGVLLGTAAYMSPEQARGKAVDKRSDIWAFGCVLYEMLTGRALFAGDTVTDVLAAVVTREPDWSAVPSPVRRLLTHCLQKDPRQRLRDIGDARALLDTAGMESPVAATASDASRHRILPWAVAALLGAAAAAVAIIHFGEAAPQSTGPVRFQMQAALEAGSGTPAISPDGRRIVYQTSRGIFVRDVDAVEPRLLITTDNPVGTPFWSADSRSIAYSTSSKLMRVDATGGPPQSICDLPGILLGGLWTADDRVLFVTASGLQTVSARGGPVSQLALPPGVRLRSGHQTLPDGQHFVYSVRQGAQGGPGIFVARLDGTGEPVRLLPDGESDAAFVTTPEAPGGYLLFLRQGALVAQAFDQARTQLAGSPVVVATGVESFTASANGDLAYLGATTARRLTWFDRQGKPTGTAWAPGPYLELSLSPDGSRVAVVRADPPTTWVHDFSREASAQLSQSGLSVKPIWSPDGNTLVYVSGRVGGFDLYRAAVNGEGSGTALVESSTFKYPASWSSDGRWLLYTNVDPATKEDLWVLPMSEGDKPAPEPFLITDYSETDAAFSPEGRLVAYVSNESGMPEVWVRAFPAGTAGKWAISSGGGYQPRWSSNGRELLFISGKSELMSVDVTAGAGFSAASPRRLFPVPIYGGGASLNNRYWDVTPDGQRFLVTTTGDGAGTSTLTVVLNFAEELKRLVPTP